MVLNILNSKDGYKYPFFEPIISPLTLSKFVNLKYLRSEFKIDIYALYNEYKSKRTSRYIL